MRLVRTAESANGRFEIKEFSDNAIPPYAILSHTWGEEEVTFQDMQGTSATLKKGYEKIKQGCALARRQDFNLDYIWIDTCCIDKTSSSELSEAINSMFRWYQESRVCFAFLADVSSKDDFPKSRWFTRGWTLQELIAPSHLVFFRQDWTELRMGSLEEVRRVISNVTGIPVGVLSDKQSLEKYSVAQRMSWASKRETTRVEDGAYCLMGLFGVNIPLIYGERESAFIRLQEEIMRVMDDHTIFAWKAENGHGILAPNSAAFRDSHDIVCFDPFDTPTTPLSVSNRGIHLNLRFKGVGHEGLGLAILHCKGTGSRKDKLIAIYVKDLSMNMQQFQRVRTDWLEPIDLINLSPVDYHLTNMCVQADRMTHIHSTTSEVTAPPKSLKFLDPEIFTSEDLAEMMGPGVGPKDLLRSAAAGTINFMWLLLTRDDVDIEIRDEWYQRTPLLCAAANGHESAVRLLLERGADIEAQDRIFRTPLILAAMGGHGPTVKLLLAKGSVVDAKDKKDQTALLYAVELNHYSVAQILIDRISATQGSGVFVPSIRRAVMNGHDCILKLLLDQGVSTETKMTERGGTRLLYAAAERELASTVYLLLENGARVLTDSEIDTQAALGMRLTFTNANDYISTLRTVFSELLLEGVELRVEEKDIRLYQIMSFLVTDSEGKRRKCERTLIHNVVQILFGKDGNIQEFEDTSSELLTFATTEGCTSMVKTLLEKGVDVEGKEEGPKPLWLAVDNGHPLIVKMLLEEGANPERGGRLRIPLQVAAEEGNTVIARILIEHGANPDGQGSELGKPLSVAAMRGYTPIVKLLLECGANPNIIAFRYTCGPLSFAAQHGYIWIVQLLLEHGAAVEGLRHNKRPLALAIKNGYEPIVDLLLKKGARMTWSDKLLRMSPWVPPRRELPAFHQYHCYCETAYYS
ncbi:hypothetical protein VI817_003433 [Penicillium citrinum]|nr:hypothetical protein VI817_003433 [Penicillium citrinum]